MISVGMGSSVSALLAQAGKRVHAAPLALAEPKATRVMPVPPDLPVPLAELVQTAAPDLLAACEAVIAWASTPGDHGGNPYLHAFVKWADTAIKQARGEA